MRIKIINYLKNHQKLLHFLYKVISIILNFINLFIIKRNQILITSYGGRKFDDSPKAIYEEIIKRKKFNNFKIVWAFVNPNDFTIPVGKKVKIDTISFFIALMKSKILISNTGIDRAIGLSKRNTISIETWHGAPIKKICGEENMNSIKNTNISKKLDNKTIRCAQSEFDQKIFARVFKADISTILLCDLPRNDELVKKNNLDTINQIKNKLNLPLNKKIILYMPTYREYWVDKDYSTYMKIPLDFNKWEQKFNNEYIILVRAHYAVCNSLNIKFNSFIYDVSKYSFINDLYLISDILISDYSSAYFDYSILKRPMLCYAFDLEEYSQKRGLYVDLKSFLPCNINQNENELINEIEEMDYNKYCKKTNEFHNIYSKFAGNSAKIIVDELEKNIL